MKLEKNYSLVRRLYVKIFIVVLLILICFLLHSLWGVYRKNVESRGNMEKVEKQLEDLKNKENVLKKDIDFLGTDSGKEDEIRKKYGVVKEGEEVVIILDNKSEPTTTSESESGFFEKMLKKMGDLF